MPGCGLIALSKRTQSRTFLLQTLPKVTTAPDCMQMLWLPLNDAALQPAASNIVSTRSQATCQCPGISAEATATPRVSGRWELAIMHALDLTESLPHAQLLLETQNVPACDVSEVLSQNYHCRCCCASCTCERSRCTAPLLQQRTATGMACSFKVV